jgi:hypothetical protein
MELFSDEAIGGFEEDLAIAEFDGSKWSNPNRNGGHCAGHFIKWH